MCNTVYVDTKFGKVLKVLTPNKHQKQIFSTSLSLTQDRMQFFFTVAIIYHMDLLLYTVLKPTFILHFLSKHEHGSCITCSSSFLSHSSVSKVMLISKLVSLIIKPGHLLIADTMTMIHSHRVSGADLTWTCNNSLWSQHRDNTVSHFPTS